MKVLTINQIEQTPVGAVWVINTTKGQDKGSVIFTVPKSNGTGLDTVIVPNTFLALNLTEQVTKSQLINSSEFRRAVAQKLITIIAEEDALKLYEMEGAEEEKKRILEILKGEGAFESGHEEITITDNIKIHPTVITLLEEEKIDEIATINSLRTLELKQEDYEYILEKSAERRLSRLHKYASLNLKRD